MSELPEQQGLAPGVIVRGTVFPPFVVLARQVVWTESLDLLETGILDIATREEHDTATTRIIAEFFKSSFDVEEERALTIGRGVNALIIFFAGMRAQSEPVAQRRVNEPPIELEVSFGGEVPPETEPPATGGPSGEVPPETAAERLETGRPAASSATPAQESATGTAAKVRITGEWVQDPVRKVGIRVGLYDSETGTIDLGSAEGHRSLARRVGIDGKPLKNITGLELVRREGSISFRDRSGWYNRKLTPVEKDTIRQILEDRFREHVSYDPDLGEVVRPGGAPK